MKNGNFEKSLKLFEREMKFTSIFLLAPVKNLKKQKSEKNMKKTQKHKKLKKKCTNHPHEHSLEKTTEVASCPAGQILVKTKGKSKNANFG